MARHTRPLRALRRVLVAPLFVLVLWAMQMLVARLLAAPVRIIGTARMGQWSWFDDGHRVRAVIELIQSEPPLAAMIATSVLTSAVIGAIVSVLVAPAVLVRLGWQGEPSRPPRGELARATGRYLPAMLVQTGYGLVTRAAFGGLAAIPSATLGPAGLPLTLAIAAIPVLVLDRARAAVVLEDAAPYHPRTHLRALVHVLRRPLWLLTGALLEGAKLIVGIVALLFVVSPAGVELGGGAVWVARLGGLLALIFGLWRVGLAVEDSRARQN